MGAAPFSWQKRMGAAPFSWQKGSVMDEQADVRADPFCWETGAAPILAHGSQRLRPVQDRHRPLEFPYRGADASRAAVRAAVAGARFAGAGGARERDPVRVA